jgi:nucleotide-binding universal stress UspA family protein
MQFTLDAPMSDEVATAIRLLEAIEHEASRAGVPVDARVESGRTPIHALERLWDVENFDRVVIPAPAGREPGLHAEGATLDAHARTERDADPATRPRPG